MEREGEKTRGEEEEEEARQSFESGQRSYDLSVINEYCQFQLEMCCVWEIDRN